MYYIQSVYTSSRRLKEGILLINWINGELRFLGQPAATIWEQLSSAKHVKHLYHTLHMCQGKVDSSTLVLGLSQLVDAGFLLCASDLYELNRQINNRCTRRGINTDDLLGILFSKYNKSFQDLHILKAELELTMSCNLRCRHCYIVDHRDLNPLSINEYVDLLKELHQNGTVFLSLTGGEVTLHKNFLQCIRIAHEQDFIVSVFTNGVDIHEDKLREISECLPANVFISLYGTSAKTHDYVTRSDGSFYKTISTVRTLRELCIPVVLRFLIMHHNSKAVSQLSDLAEKLDCLYMVSPTLFSLKQEQIKKSKYEASDKDIITLYGQDLIPPPKRAKCIAARNRIRISPNGDIYPCDLLRIVLGNIRDVSIKQALTSPAALSVRSQTHETPLIPCQQCKNQKDCPRCPGLSLYENGNLNGISSTACRLIKLHQLAHNKVTDKT